jgi:pimeloyl-ACP methyl ester carboxylesterase
MLLAGHSQGGHAVLFAAGEADEYSPKLKLRGTVAYAPGSHILQQAQSLELLTQPSPLSALAAMIVSGASTASPAVDPEALLSPEALALYPQVEDVCLSQLSRPDSFGGIAPADMLAEDADTGPLFEVLEDMNPAVRTRAPILLAQGDADTTALKFFTDLLDEELRELGDDVTYNVYEGVGHGEVVDVAQPDVLGFFEQRLPGGR